MEIKSLDGEDPHDCSNHFKVAAIAAMLSAKGDSYEYLCMKCVIRATLELHFVLKEWFGVGLDQ